MKILYESDYESLKNIGYYFMILSKNNNLGLHKHDFYEIVYMLSGSVTQSVNKEILHVNEFEYLLLRPADTHELLSFSPNALMAVLAVSKAQIGKFFELFGKDVENYIETSKGGLSVYGDFSVKLKIDEIYERILKYGDDDGILCRLFANEILSGIVRRMHRRKKSDEIPAAIVKAVGEMKQFKNLRGGVPALEKLTGYSRPQLCRLVKRFYGKTPLELVSDLRLNFAYNMIQYSNMDFEEISEMVGYNSFSHFHKKFLEKFHVTPAQHRRQNGIIK